MSGSEVVVTAAQSPDVCAICLDVMPEVGVRALPCAHVYHLKCIARWLEMAPEPRCPQCATIVPGVPRKPISNQRHVEEQMREAEAQLRTIRRINQQAEADMEALEQALRDAEHETHSRSRGAHMVERRTQEIERRATERMANAERQMGAVIERLHAAERALPADGSATADAAGRRTPRAGGALSPRAGGAVGMLRGGPVQADESLASWVSALERGSPRLATPRATRDASLTTAYRTSIRGAREDLAAAQWLPAHPGSTTGGVRPQLSPGHWALRPLDHRAAPASGRERGRLDERNARAALQQAQAAVRVAGRHVPRNITRPSKRLDGAAVIRR